MGRQSQRRRSLLVGTLVLLLALPWPVLAQSGDENPPADEEYDYADDSYPYEDIDEAVDRALRGEDPSAGMLTDVEVGAVADEGIDPERAGTKATVDAAKVDSGFDALDALKGAGEKTFDALMLRPVGALATVAGVGFFLVATPFLAVTGNLKTGQDVFVMDRARNTFRRPLGRF